jgi:lipopolysaccharide transport system permease protein
MISSLRLTLASAARNRDLLQELVWRDLSGVNATNFLGWLWTLLQPAIMVMTYVFIFTFVFSVRDVRGDVVAGYELYLLAGIIPWIMMADLMIVSTGLIKANSDLVKQIVFPLEILVCKAVLAAFVVQLLMMAVVLIYWLLAVGPIPLSFFILYPGALFLQATLAFGMAFLLAAIGPYIQDVREVVIVIARIGLFAAPILYSPQMLTSNWAQILLINPFSYMVWTYQDAVYFGTLAHPMAWLVMVVLGPGVLIVGNWAFAKLSRGFGDVI